MDFNNDYERFLAIWLDKDFTSVDEEIEQIQRDASSVTFTSPINVLRQRLNFSEEELQTNYEFTFDAMYTVPRENRSQFVIQMGGDDVPRFSCACHKLNIAIKSAIESQATILRDLRLLNSTNVGIRKSIQLNEAFRTNKCRLRLENTTRWSSAYLMLESVKRAYDKGVFSDGQGCPIPLRTVETYLQVLKPAYLLSVSLQKSKSSIADVIPG